MNLNPADPNYNNSKGVSYSSGFFMLLGFAILGLVISSFISAGILLASTGGSVEQMQDALKDPANADMIRLIQVGSVFLSMFLPALIVAAMLNRKPFHLLGFRSDANFRQAGLVILIVIVSIFVAASLGTLNKELADIAGWKGWSERLEKSYNEQVAVMLDVDSIGGYFLSLLLMAFIPALCEEMLFRGGLQNFLTRAVGKPWVSIIIVSILFSLVHFSIYGFLVRLFLGIILGLIFHYTKNIWLSIAAHFFNNALAVTSIFVFMRQGKNMEEAMNQDVTVVYWGLLALPLLFVLFRALRKPAIS
jgi:membrane protease YdiL (CAAX protease family)